MLETVGHRVIWTFLLLTLVIGVRGQLRGFVKSLKEGVNWRFGLPGIVLLLANWFTFTWCVYTGDVLASSLGYYLSPLAIVLLARFVEGEKQSRLAWAGIGSAFLGVFWLVMQTGELPVASLMIAFTWAMYNLLKKRIRFGPVRGLAFETLLGSPLMLVYLVVFQVNGAPGFDPTALPAWIWAVSTGVVTTIPLLLHAAAAKRIPLAMLGFFQFIVPTLHFLQAVILFKEDFSRSHAITFLAIWLGVACYLWAGKKTPRKEPGRCE